MPSSTPRRSSDPSPAGLCIRRRITREVVEDERNLPRGVVVHIDVDLPVARPFLGDDLPHDLSLDRGGVHQGKFHDLAHFRGDLGDDRAYRPGAVVLLLLFVPAGEVALEFPAEFLEHEDDLPLDLRDGRDRVLALAREGDVRGCHMDHDQRRTHGEALLREAVTLPVHL
ncbi:MAG: hypothetical protein XD82_0875 [Methanoculleus marisnigri]|uniref:Uncharacterized protein n=1 Tax=Methanoculleus marisnigri TaxID=2198 RepID=A0A101GP28_9EURY|nr:MAG: hypothetical protein XD82_0875 [Methanoculleus marisnigri]